MGAVFNLVYVSNGASLHIWDSLGFQRVGLSCVPLSSNLSCSLSLSLLRRGRTNPSLRLTTDALLSITVPEAGLLKKADGSGEEYTDAVVFYKKF